MTTFTKEFARVLHRDGDAFIVVGDSTVRERDGVAQTIAGDAALRTAAEEVGLVLFAAATQARTLAQAPQRGSRALRSSARVAPDAQRAPALVQT